MFSKIVLVGIVSALLMIQSSTSSPIENEKLVALSERFDKLQTKLESLESENEGLKIRVDSLQIKVYHLEGKDIEQEAKIKKQEEEIIQLKVKMNAKLMEAIQSTGPSRGKLVTDLRSFHNKKINSIYEKEGSSEYSSTKALVPASCRDLSQFGHTFDGFYLVQNVDTKKIETVFCDFGTSISQEFIGNVDVKTQSVHFHVQRNTSFNTPDATIPFELARLNEGGAFNLASGIFTAPVAGMYQFSFTGLKDTSTSYLRIGLQINGAPAMSWAWTEPRGTGSEDSLSLTTLVRLKAGDRVNLRNYQSGTLIDNANHINQFSGWLVEEDL